MIATQVQDITRFIVPNVLYGDSNVRWARGVRRKLETARGHDSKQYAMLLWDECQTLQQQRLALCTATVMALQVAPYCPNSESLQAMTHLMAWATTARMMKDCNERRALTKLLSPLNTSLMSHGRGQSMGSMLAGKVAESACLLAAKDDHAEQRLHYGELIGRACESQNNSLANLWLAVDLLLEGVENTKAKAA